MYIVEYNYMHLTSVLFSQWESECDYVHLCVLKRGENDKILQHEEVTYGM